MEITIDENKIEKARKHNKLNGIVDRLELYNPENDLNEIRAAEIFAKVFSARLRFNTTSGTYYFYNGRYWEKDLEAVHARALAKDFTKAVLMYAATLENDDLRANTFTFYGRYNRKSNRDSLIADAQTELHISENDFDKDCNLFNVRNGTIDLKTFEIHDHQPDDLITNFADVEYIPGARSELWERFISDVLPHDIELQRYVKKALGYGMTGNPELERMFVFYGATTRNGKSTLLNTVTNVLGSYATDTPAETLQRKEIKNSSAPSDDLAKLSKCRFVTVAEPDQLMVLDIALIKRFTGRDKIPARRLYEKGFEYEPKFSLFMNTNYLPKVLDNTLFSSRRVEVVPFTRHFTEAEQDITLKNKLRTEESKSAVLAWLLEGLKEYRAQGLKAPMVVNIETRRYEQQSDKLQRFIDSELEETERPELTVKACYEAYKMWCTSCGFTAEGSRVFSEKLRAKNLVLDSATIEHKTVRNVINGYRLNN